MTVNSRRTPHINDLSDYQSAEENLPYWARSTNPIVRRHLGLYWRTVPPELEPFGWLFGGWTVLLLIGILLPSFFGFIMLSFIAAIMIVPVALVIYGSVLLHVAINAARNMQAEMKNNTFLLLRATPMHLSQIFLGKISAAIWERMDDIVLVIQLALLASPPLIFRVYSNIWSDPDQILTVSIVTILSLAVLFARLVLEPLMVGAIAVFVGLVVPGRSRAISTAVVLSGFYFLLLNLLSNLPTVRGTDLPDGSVIPPDILLIGLFDFVLPVALPLLIIGGTLKLAATIVRE